MKKPLFDKIIVEKISEDKTKGGIFIPNAESYEQFYKGVVLAKGNDVIHVQENDVVAISKHSGIDWKEEEVWYRVIREQDILFIL